MHVDPRLLRQHADTLANPTRPPTRTQIETLDRILAVGLDLLVHYGRAALTTALLAQALTMRTSTFQRYFADIDVLLAEFIAGELRRLTRILADIPPETPNRPAACRAAWLAATRRGAAHTRAHTLLIRDLPLLPEDLRRPLEHTLNALAAELAGPLAPHCLALLNAPSFTPTQIEAILTAIAPQEVARREPARRPARPPAPSSTEVPQATRPARLVWRPGPAWALTLPAAGSPPPLRGPSHCRMLPPRRAAGPAGLPRQAGEYCHANHEASRIRRVRDQLRREPEAVLPVPGAGGVAQGSVRRSGQGAA